MANVTILLNCTNNTGSAVSYLSIRVAFANNPSMLYVWESPQSLAAGASTNFTLAVPEGDSPAPISSGLSNVVFYMDSLGITSCAVAILDPDVVFVEGDIYSISLSAADSGGGDEGGGDSGGGGGDTPSGSVIKVTYNLRNFVAAKASSGALCVMTLKNYSSDTITSIDDAFKGAGICRLTAPKTYALTVSSVVYLFNEKGNPVNDDSENYKLHLGEIPQYLTEAGGAVGSDIKTVVTRAIDGTYTSDTVEQANTVLIESLNARDNFAINALKTLMLRADKNPSSLSNNEIAFYCDTAYQWAANMMSAAAKVRASMKDDTETDKVELYPVGDLDTNNEKLLNNLVYSEQRTDYVEETEELDDEGNPIKEYSERIINPKLNKILKNFIENSDDEDSPHTYEDLLDILLNVQEDVNGDIHTRVKVHDWDGLKAVIATELHPLSEKLGDIATAINNFTTTLDARLTAIEEDVEYIRNNMPSIEDSEN